MLHHLSLGTADFERSVAFYDAILSTLGYTRVWSDIRPGQVGQAVGYGQPGQGDQLALKQVAPGSSLVSTGFHLAFAASSPEAVRAFYSAAIERGAQDNGAPGYRPQYGSEYFAAFVVDPNGHRLEAVHTGAA